MSHVYKCAWVVLAVVCGGCAHLPDATVGYYLARTKVGFKVNRTVVCDSKNHVFMVNAATPTVTHFADRDQFKTVDLSGLRGFLSNTDVKFEYQDDGRLKTVNATSTGQGEAILKTAIAVAAQVGMFSGTRRVPDEARCKIINDVGGGVGKPISLAYDGEFEIAGKGEIKVISPDAASSVNAERLKEVIGEVCVLHAAIDKLKLPVVHAPGRHIPLDLRHPGLVSLRVASGSANTCTGEPIWEGKVLAGQHGEPYSLPMPVATVFGKQSLSATIHDSGMVTLVQFVSDTGAGQALNVINSALTEMQNEATRRANALNAEASLIAAQQRLARCKADPTTCS